MNSFTGVYLDFKSTILSLPMFPYVLTRVSPSNFEESPMFSKPVGNPGFRRCFVNKNSLQKAIRWYFGVLSALAMPTKPWSILKKQAAVLPD